jgi:hypothetical protein
MSPEKTLQQHKLLKVIKKKLVKGLLGTGFKKDQRRQLEAVRKEEDPADRHDDEVRDDQDQKVNLPIHETTNIVNAACLRQWDEEDDACLNIDVEEHSMVEEGGKEHRGSLKTYNIESSKEKEMEPTHH